MDKSRDKRVETVTTGIPTERVFHCNHVPAFSVRLLLCVCDVAIVAILREWVAGS